MTLDGGLSVGRHATAGFVWLWGLELITSDRESRALEPAQNAGWPTGPRGGVEVRNAPGCRLINLIVHGTNGGVALWKGAEGCELYGCLIYGNGYRASDRNHVHGIYTQNRVGRRFISDCIITTPYGDGQLPLQAYGSPRAWVNGYTVCGNILYAPSQRKERLLVGGQRDGGVDNAVTGNYCYNVGIQLGYSGLGNRHGAVADNVVFRGRITVQNYLDALLARNTVVDGRIRADGCGAVTERANRVYSASSPPALPLVRVLPNRYEPDRANVVIFNWRRQASVQVDASSLLRSGDRYALLSPESFHGKPILAGAYAGAPISVPMSGEFVAFVLMRGDRGRAPSGSVAPAG